jgi:hypothetical protein
MPLDAVLVKFAEPHGEAEQAMRAAARAAKLDCHAITVHAAVKDRGAYAYAWLATPASEDPRTVARFADALASPQGIVAAAPTIVPLQRLLELHGASVGELALFHYVVETGVDAAHERDFNAWYDREHLPGLAAVPGCIRARRLRSLTKSGERTLYVACYDLVSDQALTSDAWLAVRHTPWSDRVRPQFRETTRTMFRTISRSAEASIAR